MSGYTQREVLNRAFVVEKVIEVALSYDNSAGTADAVYTVLTNNYTVKDTGEYTVQVAMDQSLVLNIVLNGTAYALNGGSVVGVNVLTEDKITLAEGDVINFQIIVPAGLVLSGILRVFVRKR